MNKNENDIWATKWEYMEKNKFEFFEYMLNKCLQIKNIIFPIAV